MFITMMVANNMLYIFSQNMVMLKMKSESRGLILAFMAITNNVSAWIMTDIEHIHV